MTRMISARRLAVLLAVVIGGGVLAPVASAHHSHPIFYDMCATATFEGRVTRVQWKMPHSLIDVATNGSTTYHVEWMNAQELSRRGIRAEDALTIGARVAVTAHPHRSGDAIRVSFPEVPGEAVPNTVDPTEIRRVDGSFAWAAGPQVVPPSCGGK